MYKFYTKLTFRKDIDEISLDRFIQRKNKTKTVPSILHYTTTDKTPLLESMPLTTLEETDTLIQESTTKDRSSQSEEDLTYLPFCESKCSPELAVLLEEIYHKHVYKRDYLKTKLNPKNSEGKSFERFRLGDEFLKSYRSKKPNFGFEGLGEITYLRTYSRVIVDPVTGQKIKECWFDTIKRVVEGALNLMKRHVYATGNLFCDEKAQNVAQLMFKYMFTMKMLPPGRGLWGMGTKITEDVGFYAALNNCGFVSTQDIDKEGAKIFAFLADMLMLGCGIGFDVRGHNKVRVCAPDEENTLKMIVGDTREGWVGAIALLVDSYIGDNRKSIEFDLSNIRTKDEPLKTFGGKAPGPRPLKECLSSIKGVLDKRVQKDEDEARLTLRDITDICNLIGVCVKTGNVRRSAEIAFGDPDSQEFIDLKDYSINPDRCMFGYVSNNSVFAKKGMDYTKVAESVYKNGEPGLMWLENAQNHGRMSGRSSDRRRTDKKAMGGNPCLEQTLESYELCNLVETFPNNFKNEREGAKVMKMAYIFAKIVSLGTIHWKQTNSIVNANHRMGISISGIVQCIHKYGDTKFLNMCDSWYNMIQKKDIIYSSYLKCPVSIKTTSIKPSGTVSLLAGATPGIHDPTFSTYIRNIRISKTDPLVPALREAGYQIHEDPYDPVTTVCAQFPINISDYKLKSERETTMLEKLQRVADYQRVWADNQISATISFDKEKVSVEDIVVALDHYQHLLKGISFLPMGPIGQYKLPPYDPISREEYLKRKAQVKEIHFAKYMSISDPSKPQGCTSEKCLMPLAMRGRM